MTDILLFKDPTVESPISESLVLELPSEISASAPPPSSPIDPARGRNPAIQIQEGADSRPPHSPRAKGVTFDSVDQVMAYDESEEVIKGGEPQSGGGLSFKIQGEDASVRPFGEDGSKSAANVPPRPPTFQEQKHMHAELRDLAFDALAYMISGLGKEKDVLDTVGDAYITAELHISLVNALR
jgi:hypothetical protein